MRILSLFITGFMILGVYSQEVVKPAPAPMKMQTDEYFGTTVQDPYRNLENLEDPAVISWMKDEAITPDPSSIPSPAVRNY